MDIKTENHKLLDSIIAQQKANKRTIILEISGTPNSGKTTVLNKLSSLFSRKKIAHKILKESASECKIPNKLSPAFNYWTGSRTMTKLWEALALTPHLIICERGLFDAICWLDFHQRRDSIPNVQFETIKNYYLNEDIYKYNRYVLEMVCSPETAVKREYNINDFNAGGTIVNTDIISQFNNAIIDCTNTFEHDFSQIDTLDTDSMDMNQTVDLSFNYLFQYLTENL